MIEFDRPDGQKAPGYYAEPAAGANAPGVVMIEEWWGVTDWIKSTADQLAAAGFRVLIPDLFRGRTAAVGDEANHLVEGLNFGDATSQDAAGAAKFLSTSGSAKVGVLGYCIGGALSMLCAMDDAHDFSCGVTFYGLPPADAGDPGMMTIPIQGHWATRDAFFTLDKVDAMEARLKAGGVVYEFYRYEADHGFCNTGEVGNSGLGHYDAISAQLAWARTLEFLKKHLG
jgi:carboxymethylenebutenolidase